MKGWYGNTKMKGWSVQKLVKAVETETVKTVLLEEKKIAHWTVVLKIQELLLYSCIDLPWQMGKQIAKNAITKGHRKNKD